MSEEEWNDQSRRKLRDAIRWNVLGEVRLGRYDDESLSRHCVSCFLEDTCPEDEWSSFLDFASAAIASARRVHEAEMVGWPERTDCDRLDEAEIVLRERGIAFWQASPCCDTCTLGEFQDRIDRLDERFPGFEANLRGYAFFIDQNLPESLSESVETKLWLGYGWLSADRSTVAPDVYRQNALAVAQEIRDVLQEAGLQATWDGDLESKIGVPVTWLRRTPLK